MLVGHRRVANAKLKPWSPSIKMRSSSRLSTGMARMHELSLCWEEAKRRNKEDLFSLRKRFRKINTGESIKKGF
jgi:hypothetical protein